MQKKSFKAQFERNNRKKNPDFYDFAPVGIYSR